MCRAAELRRAWDVTTGIVPPRFSTRTVNVPPRVLYFGTYDAEVHPRVGVLREGARSAGVEVLECNIPIGFSTADRVQLLKQPWRAVGAVARIAVVWIRLALAARRIGPVDAVVVGYLGHLDVHLARLCFRGTPIVLDHLVFLADTAADRGVGGGWRDRVLEAVDGAAIAAADVVVVDTSEHAALVPAGRRDRVVVVPVGAPEQWFYTPKPPAAPTMRVVFFGLFTPLQGAPVIGDAIRRLQHREDIHFTMVGGGQEWAETRQRAGEGRGCSWTPWVAPPDLPGLVAGHDVCLGIFGSGPKSLRVVPNKVYQGAAAGCAVVTSDTEPQRRELRDDAVFVPPQDGAALADALAALADDPERLLALRRAAHARAQAEYRPERVVRPLLERLSLGESDGGL